MQDQSFFFGKFCKGRNELDVSQPQSCDRVASAYRMSFLDLCHARHTAAGSVGNLTLSHSAPVAIVTCARCAQSGSPESDKNSQGSFQVDNKAYERDLRKRLTSSDAVSKVYVLRLTSVLWLLIVAYSA